MLFRAVLIQGRFAPRTAATKIVTMIAGVEDVGALDETCEIKSSQYLTNIVVIETAMRAAGGHVLQHMSFTTIMSVLARAAGVIR